MEMNEGWQQYIYDFLTALPRSTQNISMYDVDKIVLIVRKYEEG